MKFGLHIPIAILCLTGFASAETPAFVPTPVPTADQAPAAPVAAAPVPVFESQTPFAVVVPAAVPTAPTVAKVSADPKTAFQQREQILNDSIAALEASITVVRSSVETQMPVLRPKDEFETTDAFNARKASWEKERDAKVVAQIAPMQKREQEVKTALDALHKSAVDLQGSLEITSIPKGAKILVDGKELGKTPMTLEHQWAGKPVITLSLEGFMDYVATPEIKGGKSADLEATLQERGIFSPVDEVNLSAVLAKDTVSVVVFQSRIARLQARVAQVDQEIQPMLSELPVKFPLAPKGEFETQDAFNKRHNEWSNAGQKRYAELQEKHKVYRTRLLRAIEVLQDYILVAAGQPKPHVVNVSNMVLATYNADQAQYPFSVENQEDGFAFRWDGSMKISIEEAKAMNKQTTGFEIQAMYYDIPVSLNGSLVYPAFQSLQVSKAGKNFATEGVFRLPAQWLSNADVVSAVARADSLRKGLVKTRNLTPDYVLDFKGTQTHSYGRLWLNIARGVVLASSAAAFTYGYMLNRDGDRLTKNFAPINSAQAAVDLAAIHKKDKDRDHAVIAGGILALVGVVSFAF